jgi:hypothetical protein
VRRLYTGPDDLTHVEELEAPENATIPVRHVELKTLEGKGTTAPHNARWPHFAIVLEGGIQIGCADGVVDVAAGEVLIVEDMTGAGHTTTRVTDRFRMIALPIEGRVGLDAWRTSA